MSTAQPAAQTGAERWILLATILASSMAFIDSSALNVALPALQTDLGIRGAGLLWIVNGYSLFLSSLILVGGSLGDHYGRKRVFMAGIMLFTLASVACGLANTIEVLIIARAVQGIGGALMVPGSLAILSAAFTAERRGAAIGTWSTFSTLTTVLGPVLGGWLAGQGLWRAVFFINVPLAAIALVVLIAKVPESRDELAPPQLDFPGALLATLGLAGLTYGFIEAPTFGFSDPRILATLGGGLVALIVFVIVEARSDHPMVPLKLFKSRTFSGTNALTLFLYAALSGALFFVPLNLIQGQGYSEEVAGFTLLPFALTLTFMSRWAGGLVDRIGARLPLTVGPFIAGVGFFMLALPGLTSGPQDYWTSFFPGIFVLGVGMGVTVAPLTTAVMGSAPAESTGTASGINNAVARTAGVLAIAIMGSVALVSFGSSLSAYTADLQLPESARVELDAEANKLADAVPPAGLSDELTVQVEQSIKVAFIDTFHLIAVIAAGLAWLSAILGALLVEGRKVSDSSVSFAAKIGD